MMVEELVMELNAEVCVSLRDESNNGEGVAYIGQARALNVETSGYAHISLRYGSGRNNSMHLQRS